ncbi:hypothetical protein G3I40_15660 [Streptomyces sp. SID14478]|uniref:hypothetical protein n=1 Tax=Streptomyces sp. SID14478 TaxID=2706073 RepID=UPI0013DD3CBB|nr:hypothetical protein [Streptomyces sp. SID14478]NEB76647.1 hypothetical protein [Streptomyces sp. SID14478]
MRRTDRPVGLRSGLLAPAVEERDPVSREVCRECGRETDEPVAVALEHVASLGGHVAHVCPVCRFALGLVPLDQHPAGSLGFPRYEPGIPQTERQWGTARHRKGPAAAR